jgi:hypothetical protein
MYQAKQLLELLANGAVLAQPAELRSDGREVTILFVGCEDGSELRVAIDDNGNFHNVMLENPDGILEREG